MAKPWKKCVSVEKTFITGSVYSEHALLALQGASNNTPLVVSAAPQMQNRPRPILVDPSGMGSNPALAGGNGSEDASGRKLHIRPHFVYKLC